MFIRLWQNQYCVISGDENSTSASLFQQFDLSYVAVNEHEDIIAIVSFTDMVLTGLKN